MPNLNVVHLIGHICRETEIKNTPSGRAVLENSIAINDKWTTESGEKREKVTFVNFEAWGRAAEVISQYCIKGDALYIQGQLQSELWEDKKTGEKRSRLYVRVDSFQLMASKKRDERPIDKPNNPPKPNNPDLDTDGSEIPF